MKPIETQPTTTENFTEIKKTVIWIYYVIFFAVLNESVFNVSTPKIAEQFGLDESGVSWVVTIFFITFGLGTVIFGKLSDIYSIKRLITIGIIVYSIGSIVGFALQSWYPAVIVSRAIQGAGGSAMPALVFVMVARYFSQEERGKLFGMITSIASFAVGIGPVLGGYIAGSFQWSYLFLIAIPVLIAIPQFRRLLPDEETREGKMDLLGGILLGAFVSMLILYTSQLHWIYLVLSIISLALFIWRIRNTKDPFVEPSLFAYSLYRNGLLVGFLIFGTVMSVMFVLPLMLSNTYHLNTDEIGLIMFPGAISAVIFGRIAGKLTVKYGSDLVVYMGLTLITLSLLVQSSTIGLWVWWIGFSLIVMYIGFSLLQTALAESITQIMPPDQIGVGMGFFNMTSILSGAVVTALVAKALEQKLFAFPLHPFVFHADSYQYGNLILLLSLVVIGSAILYYTSLGRRQSVTSQEMAHVMSVNRDSND